MPVVEVDFRNKPSRAIQSNNPDSHEASVLNISFGGSRAAAEIEKSYYRELSGCDRSSGRSPIETVLHHSQGIANVIGVDQLRSRETMQVLKRAVDSPIDTIVAQLIELDGPELRFLRTVAKERGITLIEPSGCPYEPSVAQLTEVLPGNAIRAAVNHLLLHRGVSPERCAAMLGDSFNMNPNFLQRILINEFSEHPPSEANSEKFEQIWGSLTRSGRAQFLYQIGGQNTLPGNVLVLMLADQISLFDRSFRLALDPEFEDRPGFRAQLAGDRPHYCISSTGSWLKPSDAYALLERDSLSARVLESAANLRWHDPRNIDLRERVTDLFQIKIDAALAFDFGEVAARWARTMWRYGVEGGYEQYVDLTEELFDAAVLDGDLERASNISKELIRAGIPHGRDFSDEVLLLKEFKRALHVNGDLDHAVQLAQWLYDLEPEYYGELLTGTLLQRMDDLVNAGAFDRAEHDAQRLHLLGHSHALTLLRNLKRATSYLDDGAA